MTANAVLVSNEHYNALVSELFFLRNALGLVLVQQSSSDEPAMTTDVLNAIWLKSGVLTPANADYAALTPLALHCIAEAKLRNAGPVN